MPTQLLQCPFCEKTSTAPQGLSAHVRNNHQKQYPKWIKNPNRFQPVQANLPKQPESVRRAPKTQPGARGREASQTSAPPPADPTGDGALQLVNQAREQLVDRKRVIEAQLAHVETLRTELERVNAQIESLDSALGVFKK